MVERLYGALLYAYPRSLRRTYAAEMRQCARATLARRGAAGMPRLYADLLVSIPREWTLLLREHVSGWRGDVGYALRLLWRSPGFAAAAIVTLALGIGANAAIFSLADATLLHPLRVAAPDRLVGFNSSFSYPDYRSLASHTDRALRGLLAVSGSGRLAAEIDGAAEGLSPTFVSGNYFSVLGVTAAHGRTLGPADDVEGAPLVGVLSHDWFRARFGGDPAAIGRTIRVSGETIAIVGVAQPGFRGTSLYGSPTLFVPLAATPRIRKGFFSRPEIFRDGDFMFLSAIGRLRDGASPAQAAAVVDAGMIALDPPAPTARREALQAIPLTARALGEGNASTVARFVWLLTGVVGLTLLIACANLANLLLARNADREREIRVRLALGAARSRVCRQLLTESLVLATLGGLASLWVATVAQRALALFELPGGIDIGGLRLEVNGATVGFTALLAVATGLLFGAAPALRASGSALTDVVRAGSRSVTSRGTLRGSLVAVQVALSVVLLAGSALFAQSVMRALRVPLGFDVDHVATASVNLETVGYTAPRASTFYADVIEQVRRQPAVEAAAWSTVMPIVGVSMFTVSIEGAQPGDATFDMSEVGPGYFAATRTTLVDGRPFSIADGPGAEPVAIVNETAARRYWNGRALGRHVRIGDAAWRTIVGVTRDTKAEALVETTPPYLYVPLAQQQDARLDNVHLFARVKGDADQALPLLVNAIRSVDRRVPIYSVMTFEDRVRELTMPFRLGAMLFTGFSLLAVTLAVVGIYGVTTFVAGRRTREIGIRLALGAPRTEVIALVVRQGAQPIAVGLASGIALALALGRTAESLLFQADPRDPVTLAAVSIALGVVALAANYIPARRAARLDPVAALRDE